MDPQQITELANLMRKNGDKILSSEFTLTLSGSLLRALNDSFTLIADNDIGSPQQTFQVVKSINATSHVFPDLQLLHDFVQKTTLLRIVYYPSEHFEGVIDIVKFRALKRLEVQKTNINQVVGIQQLRGQLQQLICVKSLRCVDDIITRCGGDNSNGFVWNELKTADFSYNNLQTVDTALEFAQYLQHLNLRHNKLHSVSAIKWLPNLKTLDLSYNCLTTIPQFHMEAYKRLQLLNMSNNFVEELLDLAKLDALSELNLSDNCLLDHAQLLPLSALVTLSVLNLYGNPLHCHPKHRLATAQYLHKNTACIKFLLDFEPLSKAEKAVTGSCKLRYPGLVKTRVRRSTQSVNISQTISSNASASSLDSRRSFKLQESSSEPELVETLSSKRRPKGRTVDIEEHDDANTEATTSSKSAAEQPISPVQEQQSMNESTDGAHLETKKQIETLRVKYGTDWLQKGHPELMQIITLDQNSPKTDELERNKSRQLLDDYLGDLSAGNVSSVSVEPINVTSTPTNDSTLTATFEATITPISAAVATNETTTTVSSNMADETVYLSCDTSVETQDESQRDSVPEQPVDDHAHLRNVYETSANSDLEEPEVSDTEPDEVTYIVYNANKTSEPLLFTISSNFLREKDALTERTKTKWSLKILESCERIRSNMLCIHFDTVKKDKRERIYSVENALCQELERKLRDIMADRDLTEMNISIYRCVNCGSQFTREHKQKRYNTNLRCPDCGSTFIADVHELPTSLEKASAPAVAAEPRLSPALIVEESPVGTPLVVQAAEDNNSIGSANSLNESSSCSKITNSQCSFDSNQSVVGSSNTDRDLEFRANESDVDIISNPSQSSIEVLDPNCAQTASRKTSEERRISQMPNLQTINDDMMSYTQSFIEREFGQILADQAAVTATAAAGAATAETAPKTKSLAHVQLTESSSSGSVTDSICTTYEKDAKEKQLVQSPQAANESVVLHNMLLTESNNSNGSNNNNELVDSSGNGLNKKDEAGLSSMFGALFQSTNMLMSSSKKLIENESVSRPYKFNYTDFNDVDHRLKLYFYQCKFEDGGESFKWVARGHIFNDQTQTLSDGLVVMSSCKCYLMEAYAAPHDDVSKWLRQVINVRLNRLARIQLLPWKLGLSFTLRDWGSFLLLQDILRTDSLLLFITNNSPPEQCELIYEPAAAIVQRLNNVTSGDKLKMCTLLHGLTWTSGDEKRSFELCTLLITDTHLYLNAGKFNWLSTAQETAVEITLMQLMSNLVDLEPLSEKEYNINFLDETLNESELWHLKFESPENAKCCLNIIGQSWEQLFGVPLLNA